MTFRHLVSVGYQTLRVCVPSVAEASVGALEPEDVERRLDRWSRRLLEGAGITLRVCGKEHFKGRRTFVVMSNHQSHYDIPVLYQAFEKPMRMVAKKELFRIPVFGAAMRAGGFVELDRRNRKRAIASLNRARASLAAGVNIWIAPEGTRSRTGRLGPFKKGGFHLAVDTGAPILPVTIEGTNPVLIPGSMQVHPGAQVTVTFSAPVCTQGKSRDDIPELIQAVQAVIARHLPPELRGEAVVGPSEK